MKYKIYFLVFSFCMLLVEANAQFRYKFPSDTTIRPFLKKLPNIDSSSIDQIHFGSKGNTLRGVTVGWRSVGVFDSIRWGYSTKYEEGKALAENKGPLYDYAKSHIHEGYNFFYTFSKLKPKSTVHFSVYNSYKNIWTGDHIFNTSADTLSQKYSFTFNGDCHQGDARSVDWSPLSDAIPVVDFNINLGDMVHYGGNALNWDLWFDYSIGYNQTQLVFPTLGNHERHTAPYSYEPTAANYWKIFTTPANNPQNDEGYYSFTMGKTVYISLNSELFSLGSSVLDMNNAIPNKNQLDWLTSELKKYAAWKWKIVFFHKPFVACRATDELTPSYDAYWKLFDKYGVDIILNGHIHGYMRSKPINIQQNASSPVSAYGSSPQNGRCEIMAGEGGGYLYGSCYPGTPLMNNYGNYIWADYAADVSHFGLVTVSNDTINYLAKDMYYDTFDSYLFVKRIFNYILEEDSVTSEFGKEIKKLNVVESDPAESRQWLLGTSPTTISSTNVTTTSFPLDMSEGIYYIQCKSTRENYSAYSNIVKVRIYPFNSIFQFSEDNLKIFTSGKNLNVEINTMEEKSGNVKIHSILGNLITNSKMENNRYTYEFEKSGIYIVTVQINNKQYNRKIMIE